MGKEEQQKQRTWNQCCFCVEPEPEPEAQCGVRKNRSPAPPDFIDKWSVNSLQAHFYLKTPAENGHGNALKWDINVNMDTQKNVD